MRRFALLLASFVVLAVPASAQGPRKSDPLLDGLLGALRGCEAWVLEPSTWNDGPAPFLARIGLSGRVFETDSIPDLLLPPESLRRANRYWRIGTGGENGFVLVVSQDLPMCHITGGGVDDLQPVAEKAVAAPGFTDRWEFVSQDNEAGIVSTLSRSREDGALTLLFSRADAADARRDRPQVVATATYDLGR